MPCTFMNIARNLTFLLPIFLLVGAREGWGVDVKWHMSGRDHFGNTPIAFLQDAYFSEGDVNLKK